MIKVNGNEIKFETFPNGETRIENKTLPEQGYIIQNIAFKYENDSDLIKLMLLKNHIENYYSRKHTEDISLTIYYMPYSRMDRSEYGSPFTLKYVANFINSLNFPRVYVIEPHSDVTCALLNNVIPVYINFELLPLVKKEVGFNPEEDYIMFPDLGASKRYSKMKFKNVIIGHKTRDFQTGEIKGLELMSDWNAGGKKVIIVDDLSSYGGTFVHSAEALRHEGFENINLLVAHAENSIFKGRLFEEIDRVFTTDTILTEQNYWENAKFKEQLKVFEITNFI